MTEGECFYFNTGLCEMRNAAERVMHPALRAARLKTYRESLAVSGGSNDLVFTGPFIKPTYYCASCRKKNYSRAHWRMTKAYADSWKTDVLSGASDDDFGKKEMQ